MKGVTLMTEWEAEVLNDAADGPADVPESPLERKGEQCRAVLVHEAQLHSAPVHSSVCLSGYFSLLRPVFSLISQQAYIVKFPFFLLRDGLYYHIHATIAAVSQLSHPFIIYSCGRG